jgi:hypothetical protein
MKSILERLGGKKGAVSSSKDKSKSAKPLEKLDDESIKLRLRNFGHVCDYIAEFPKEGTVLLDYIISNKKLFAKYIDTLDYLTQLISMRQGKIDTFLEIIMTEPDCGEELLDDFEPIVKINELFKRCMGELYQDDLIKYALSKKEIYSELIGDEDMLEQGLILLPGYRTTFMEILANNDAIFAKCMNNSPGNSCVENFCQFCKEDPTYTKAFVRHVYTSDLVYTKVIDIVNGLPHFIEQFPEEQDAMMDFVVSSDKRFERIFPSFGFIYEFCEKNPQHLRHQDKLFAKGLSMDAYVRRTMGTTLGLFEVFDFNPAHAQQIETKIIADPKWVLKINRLGFQRICEHGSFDRLKNAFLTHLYLSHDDFTFHMSTQSELDEMISIVPDQAIKLRLYFQLLKQKKPVADIIEAEYRDTQTMAELKLYIMQSVKEGTMTVDMIKSLRDQVAGKFVSAEENAPYLAALNDLKACLDFNLAPKVAELLGKSLLKGERPGEEIIHDPKAVQPNPPGRTNSN